MDHLKSNVPLVWIMIVLCNDLLHDGFWECVGMRLIQCDYLGENFLCNTNQPYRFNFSRDLWSASRFYLLSVAFFPFFLVASCEFVIKKIGDSCNWTCGSYFMIVSILQVHVHTFTSENHCCADAPLTINILTSYSCLYFIHFTKLKRN